MSAPLSLWQQVLLIALAPPVVAVIAAVMMHGWAGAVAAVLGRRVSETTKNEQSWEFWFVLWGGYAVMIGMFFYAHLFR